MPSGINGYNDAFRQFVDFAQQRIDAGDDKSVIVAKSAGGPLSGRKISLMSASATDKAGLSHSLARSPDDKQADLGTHALFRAAIKDMFQGGNGIPAEVEAILGQLESGNGQPLTARSIISVKNAIDATGASGAPPPADRTIRELGDDDASSTASADPEGGSGTATGSATQVPVAQTDSAEAAPSLFDKLKALMSRSEQKPVAGVDETALGKALRFSGIPFEKRQILKNMAKQTSLALARLDKLNPADIGAAYRAGIDRDSINALKADPDAQSTYWAAVVLRDAIDTQATLSEALRYVLKNIDLKEEKYDALFEIRLVCDRRISEIETLGVKLSGMTAAEAQAAAKGRGILQMLGSLTVDMHGNEGMFDTLAGPGGNPSATARLADKLESLKNRADALTEDEYKEFAASVRDAKGDIEDLERKVAAGETKNVDLSVLIAARGALDDILSEMDNARALSTAAVNDYVEHVFLIDDAAVFDGKALDIFRESGMLPNLVSILEKYQVLIAKAKALIADPGNAAARKECRDAYSDYLGDMESLAVSADLARLSSKRDVIIDGASRKAKSAFSKDELEELRQAMKRVGDADQKMISKLNSMAGWKGLAVDHVIEMAENAARIGGGAFAGEAVHAMVEGKASFGTMVGLFAHGFAPGDIPPQGVDDAHIISKEFLGAGGLNSVYKVIFRSEDGSDRAYVFKPELVAQEGLWNAVSIGVDDYISQQQSVMLNMASQYTADALGVGDVMARSFGGTCAGEYGTFMELAQGVSAKVFNDGPTGPEAFGKGALQDLARQVQAGDKAATDKARNLVATLARSANRLEWLDIVTGQLDRHGKNFFVQIDGRTGTAGLKAIDNDLCYTSTRTGLLKFKLDKEHSDKFNTWLRNLRTKLYPGLTEAEFNAAFKIDAAHGVERHSDDTVTLDAGNLGSRLLLGALEMLSFHCAPIPDEIDRDVYDKLMSLGKQADGQPTPERTAYLNRLRTRLGKASFDAAVLRLDEAIALARKLESEGKVRAPEYWASDEAIVRAGQPRTDMGSADIFPKIGNAEAPSLEALEKSNRPAANLMAATLDNVATADHYLRRDFPDVCKLAALVSGDGAPSARS